MKQSAVIINRKKIKNHGNVFIIAEAGVNHNQQLALALKMVDEAAAAGADAVKFQTFQPNEVVLDNAPTAEYQAKNTKSNQTQRALLEQVYLPESFYPKILKRCQEKNILFLSTPHGSLKAVDFLESLGVKAHKIPSGDMNDYLLLDYVAAKGKPIILSTGVAYLSEIQAAVQRIKSKGNNQIIVLHATTNYPCPPHQANLRAMETLMDSLDVPVGFSDHTQGDEAAIAATAMGMALYEFHFTLDRSLPGPDHVASCEPEEMKKKIASIKKTEVLLGDGKKEPVEDVLQSMRPLVMRSVVASHPMKKGTIINITDLEAKRPGNGVLAKDYEHFIGKKLLHDVVTDHQFQLKDVEK